MWPSPFLGPAKTTVSYQFNKLLSLLHGRVVETGIFVGYVCATLYALRTSETSIGSTGLARKLHYNIFFRLRRYYGVLSTILQWMRIFTPQLVHAHAQTAWA